MKKQIIILMATISIIVSGCSKEEIQLNRNYWGEVQASKNGEVWKPYVYATNYTRDADYATIEMATYNNDNIARENLSFSKIAKKVGYNSIKSREVIDVADENNILYYSSYYTLVADGDVICSSYQVDDSVEVAGYVDVTKYDEESGILEGTFEVTLIKDRSCDENAPDTLHFTEGVFYTKIQD